MRKSALRRPEVLLPATFLLAILAGTGVLLLPGMANGRVGPLEAFFTSTSAVCVTGLVVVETGADFTHRGQVAIMALIQLGGLGIMSLSILALTLVGRRVPLGPQAAVKESLTVVARWSAAKLLLAVVGVTAVFELVGFLVLWGAIGDAWSALFHSISGFCNAGFSLYPDSLRRFGGTVQLTILLLFVVGGLGFTTLIEIIRCVRRREHRGPRFSLHSRLVFTVSLILLGLGTLLLWCTPEMGAGDAFFMSATARTAGFDTTAVGELSSPALLTLMMLMVVGASPGSTGGGIKTTTLALVVLAWIAALKGRDYYRAHGREVPRALVRRAFAVLSSGILVVMVSIFVISQIEGIGKWRFIDLAFETVSAFGTVGLSTGITPHLTAASKLFLCLVMFVGRVGTISFFLILIREEKPSYVRYPEEKVLVG